jgi:hypothetical protein
VTDKQTPPKTKAAEEQGRKCCSCDKPDSEILFTIILPPVIMEKQDLSRPCLAVAIDNSIGKMIQ